MEIRGLAFVPLLWVLWTLLGMSALLALTVISGHYKYPMVSETGIEFPEFILYKVIFLVSPILVFAIIHLQYKFMILRSEPSEKRFIISQRILYASGWIACIGTALNAIYTLKDDPMGHRIGAGSAFITSAIYNLCQTVFLYKRSYSSRLMCHIRLALILVTIVMLTFFLAGMGALEFQLCIGLCEEIINIPARVAEWIGVIGVTLHHATVYTDFQRLSLKLSREGVSICLREKTQDPENPE